MKSDITEKINKVGKVSRIVSKIAQVVMLIGAISCLVSAVIIMFVPSDAVKSFEGKASGTIVLDEEKSKMISFVVNDDNVKKYINIMGFKFEINTIETVEDNNCTVNFDTMAINADGRHFKLIGILLSFAGVLLCTGLYIIFVFAVRLAKTLETCESPFEENVLTAMKKFGYSFIPFGVISLGLTGISAISLILVILVVILFINIFNYGAELQQESDDTV